uniref:Wiskott-Aldrich syndrome protein homolog n=3 Tax=Schistocephalus solidus TaxID=70667 RepID=A0A0X3NGW8_SCHSO
MANNSVNLTKDENHQLQILVGETGALRAVAVVQMYEADSRGQWNYFKTGVVTVEDSKTGEYVRICLYDLNAVAKVWQQNLFKEMTYLSNIPQFHYFYGENSAVGLGFTDVAEADTFRNAIYYYVRGRGNPDTLRRHKSVSVGKKAKNLLRKTHTMLHSRNSSAVAVQVSYDRQSWKHNQHIGYINGQLQVQANDEETANRLLKFLGGRVTVKNKEEMQAVVEFIQTVGIDKVTNAINQSHGSNSAGESRCPGPQPPPTPRYLSTEGRAPVPPPPPPTQAPFCKTRISTPARGGGGGGGGGFLDDIKNFKKDTLKTATSNAPIQPFDSTADAVTIDSLGDALANLLARRRGHLESDNDSDGEW